MNKNMKSAILFGMTGFLSACGGGGGDEDAAVAEARYIFEVLEGTEISEVTVAELPPTATMRGIIGAELLRSGDVTADQLLFGTTEFSADFTTGRLSGSASDFGLYDMTETQNESDPGAKLADLGGSLPVTGTIAGVMFDYTATGNLSGPATSGGTVPVATTLVSGTTAGSFAGFAKADELLIGAGDVSGTFTPAPGSALDGGTLQDGVLLVTRR